MNSVSIPTILKSYFFRKILWLIFLSLIALILYSCSSKATTEELSKKVELLIPKACFVGDEIEISIEPREPGLSNFKLTISSDDYTESKKLTSYPYKVSWTPKKPGIYNISVETFSITEGKYYTSQSSITVYDVVPPIIEEIRTIPQKPYVGDEVLLQVKVKSNNPIIEYTLDGKTPTSEWIRKTLFVHAGYIYTKLPAITVPGSVELFIKTNAYALQDATSITIEVNQIDKRPPTIKVYTDTFYPENSDVSFTLELYDNEELKSYKIEFDGEVLENTSINGKAFTKAILIGKKELGTHTLNIVAYDKEGNMSTYTKTIYVGSTALSFKVAISPSNPTAGATAVVVVVPSEKNLKFTKLIFFADGKPFATNLGTEEKPATGFALWDVEEGMHTISVYAESPNNRAGIAETIVMTEDKTGPRFISLMANDVELSKSKDKRVFPGLVTFRLTVYDPGGVSTTSKPRLLIKEDEFEGFYRDLEMEAEEISSDGKTVTFSVTTYMSLGYYYLTVMNVCDLSGNFMKDIGKFLLFVE